MTPYPANSSAASICWLCGKTSDAGMYDSIRGDICIDGVNVDARITVASDNNPNDDALCDKCLGRICAEFLVEWISGFNLEYALSALAAKRLGGK